MPRIATAESANELARQHGANYFIMFAWFADSDDDDVGEWHYLTDSPRVIEVAPGSPIATDPRVMTWGTLSMQVDPERLGGISETQITLHDGNTSQTAAGFVRTLVDASLQPSSSLFELSLLFIVPDALTGIPRVQDWDNRVILHRGSVVSPEYQLATRTWTLKLRDLGAYYDKPIGFRVDRNNFADTRGTVSEGQILPIAFGDPVLRVPAVLIDRPGTGVIAEVLTANQFTVTLVDTAKTGAFETALNLAPPATPKHFLIGVPGNFEELEGYVVGANEAAREASRTIQLTRRGWILVAGSVYSQFGLNLVLDDTDFVTYGVSTGTSRNGNIIYFSSDNGVTWVYRFLTYWRVDGSGDVVIGYSGTQDFAQFDLYRIVRYPGYIPEWPPGTPIYEVGDWTYCANAVPSTEIVRVEARAEVPSPGGGTPIKQHYTFAAEYVTADLDNRDFNVKLGRHVTDDEGITTVTLTKSPQAIGFTDPTVYVTLRGPEVDAVVATYAPDVIYYLATHPALGNIETVEHVDFAQLSAAAIWLAANRPVRLAFAITEQRQLNEVISEAALNGTCAAVWDQGRLRVIPWPAWGTASAVAVSQADAADAPTESLYEWSEMPTIALGKFRPYPSGDEITYVRRAVGAETVLGRREKEFEFALLQRPSSVVLALEFWFGWWLGRQATVSCDGFFLPRYAVALLDTLAMTWADGDGTQRLNCVGPVLEQSIDLPEPINGKPLSLSMVLPIRRRLFAFAAFGVDDIDIDPHCGDLPSIDPAYGWPTHSPNPT